MHTMELHVIPRVHVNKTVLTMLYIKEHTTTTVCSNIGAQTQTKK